MWSDTFDALPPPPVLITQFLSTEKDVMDCQGLGPKTDFIPDYVLMLVPCYEYN